MNIVNRDVSLQDVKNSVSIFKLQKLKKLIEENERDMEHATYDEFITLHQIHKHLKEIQSGITKELGTVILK